jgi:hypothetical protein
MAMPQTVPGAACARRASRVMTRLMPSAAALRPSGSGNCEASQTPAAKATATGRIGER